MNPIKEIIKFHKTQMDLINQSLSEDHAVDELRQIERDEADYNDQKIDTWKEERSAKCTKCGDLVLGDTDGLCGNCI